ncbi:tetratricopeptide repeat protein, partial [Kitasatospora sp. NPDC059571]|uniref:tetratricopeptide repeat protein n=1 Tax=Kitasatospora sp. NPDC059571 TaxID=3346871 RepID=UPI0036948332
GGGVAADRARLRDRAPAEPLGPELVRCSDRLAALPLDARRHEELAVEVLDAALGWVLAGRPDPAGATAGTAPAGGVTGAAGAAAADAYRVLGHRAEERELRFALEHSYRVLARLSDRAETRIDMVERANRARPRTWV